MRYYDVSARAARDAPPAGANYGICHFDATGDNPAPGLTIARREPAPSPFAAPRARFRERERPGTPPLRCDYFGAAPEEKRVLFQAALNHLAAKDFAKRRGILTGLLGFRDSGISVGGDALFIYDHFFAPRKFEIYLNERTGAVAELDCYDYAERSECKFPVTYDGFRHVYENVVQDLFEVWLPDGIALSPEARARADALTEEELRAAWPYLGGGAAVPAGPAPAPRAPAAARGPGRRPAGGPSGHAPGNGRDLGPAVDLIFRVTLAAVIVLLAVAAFTLF